VTQLYTLYHRIDTVVYWQYIIHYTNLLIHNGMASVKHLSVHHVNRVRFCEWLQHWLQILPDILFVHEAQFARNGITNTRNWHSRTQENPHEVAPCWFKRSFSVAVWCAVLDNKLMKHISALKTFSGTRITTVFRELTFCNTGTNVDIPWRNISAKRGHVNLKRKLWIGRGGPVTWPAWSPDLNPLHFVMRVCKG